MELLRELKEIFASGASTHNWRQIECLEEEYKAFAFKESDGYGVAIPFDFSESINIEFNNCKFYTYEISIEKLDTKLLCLSCKNQKLRNQFAIFCAELIDPGLEGENRKSILSNPVKWANNWRDLMGNTFSLQQPYSVLAELIAYEYLYQKDQNIKWTAPNRGSVDFESENEGFEIKSSVLRHSYEISISSEFQLDTEKNLYLLYCKMEQSPSGISINEQVDKLVKLGIDRDQLENNLAKIHFKEGTETRKLKFKVLEKRMYDIDDNFPKITNSSFVNGIKPIGINHIVYSLDLTVVPKFKEW